MKFSALAKQAELMSLTLRRATSPAFQALLGLLALVSSISAYAGSGAGNGGGAVVCRDPADGNKAFHVELYDLWEGRNVDELEILPSDKPMDERLKDAVLKFDLFHEFFAADVSNNLKGVEEKIKEQLKTKDSPYYLPDSNDSNRLLMPKFCPGRPEIRPEYEQVITYTDKGLLLVDQELYAALTPEEIVAIHLHEAIYKSLRDRQDEPDSVGTRKLVALVMSNAPLEKLGAAMKEYLKGVYVPKALRERLKENMGYAISRDSVEQARAILDFTPTIFGEEIRYSFDTRHLIHAIRQKKSLAVANLLLDRLPSDFDVNAPYKYVLSTTILMEAIDTGSSELVAKLLKHPRIDINRKVDSLEEYALFTAVRKNNEAVLSLLIEDPRTDLSVVGLWNKRILDFAAFHAVQSDDLTSFQYLLNHPRVPLTGNGSGYRSIVFSVVSLADATGEKTAVEVVRLLSKDVRFSLYADGSPEVVIKHARRSGLDQLAQLLEALAADPAQVARNDRNIFVAERIVCDVLFDGERAAGIRVLPKRLGLLKRDAQTKTAREVLRIEREDLRKRLDLELDFTFSSTKSGGAVRLKGTSYVYKRRKLVGTIPLKGLRARKVLAKEKSFSGLPTGATSFTWTENMGAYQLELRCQME